MKIEQKQNTHRPLYATGAAMLAASVILGGCSMTTPTTTVVELAGDTVPVEEYSNSSIVNGYRYEILKSEEWGPDLDRGWYIRDADGQSYILVCRGWFGDGGHYIDIKSISYDQSVEAVVISVSETENEEDCSDCIVHPCCSVMFEALPEKIVVVSDDGTELKYGGKIIDTDRWALDVTIDENYIAVFKRGGYCTYVYETDDGKYRYINSIQIKSDGTLKEYVKGTGVEDTIYGIEYVSFRFGSFEHVTVKGDEGNIIDAKEYIKMIGG